VYWSGYEVISIASGGVLVTVAFMPGLDRASQRKWAFLFGVGFVAYGVYIMNQTSGTFVFPWVILVIPPGVVLYLVAPTIGNRTTQATPAEQPVGQKQDG
jgi:hypothetical protein